jgi:hypothetical protein
LREAETRVLVPYREYIVYFNSVRPHLGLRQRVPAAPERCAPGALLAGSVHAVPVLGGLYHAYKPAV